VPDPPAAAAWRALQQRIAAAGPASTFVAAVQRRADRAARQRAAARAPSAAAELRRSALVEPAGLPAPLAVAPPVDRDQREDEAWFRALPAAEQTRLRAVWAGRRQRQADCLGVQRRNHNRRTVAAVGIGLAVALLGTGGAWPATVGAGVLCGIWWRHVSADRFRDPVLAVVCLGACHLVAALVHGQAPTGLFLDAILVVAFAAVVGFDGEMRRTGGFDAAADR
jgi:hypothetical protein